MKTRITRNIVAFRFLWVCNCERHSIVSSYLIENWRMSKRLWRYSFSLLSKIFRRPMLILEQLLITFVFLTYFIVYREQDSIKYKISSDKFSRFFSIFYRFCALSSLFVSILCINFDFPWYVKVIFPDWINLIGFSLLINWVVRFPFHTVNVTSRLLLQNLLPFSQLMLICLRLMTYS